MTPGTSILYLSITDTVEVRSAVVVENYCDELLVRERETGWTGTVRAIDVVAEDAPDARAAVFTRRLITVARSVATRRAA